MGVARGIVIVSLLAAAAVGEASAEDDERPRGMPPALIERAEAGDPQALFDIASSLATRGYRHDDDDAGALAVAWMRRAAEAGHPYAENELGNFYAKGVFGLDADFWEARAWYRRGAEGGDPVAVLNLARSHGDGLGDLKEDLLAVLYYEQALRAFRKDDDIRRANAVRCELSDRLELGIGAPEDPVRAARLRRAVNVTGMKCGTRELS